MDKAVSSYITDALRLNGQLWTPGGQPSPEALTECTAFFNQMLDSWNIMRNALYTILDMTYTLTPGQTQYTIGPTGQLNGPRPVKITNANLIYQTTPQELRLPIEIIDVDQWAAIRVPNLPNAIPLKLYCDYGYTQAAPTGLANLYLWPGPQSAYTLELFMWQALNSALVATNTLFAPPGYARALTYNLAIEIMPLYPKRLTPAKEMQIARIAAEARDYVNIMNAPSPITPIDSALIDPKSEGFNWLVSTN